MVLLLSILGIIILLVGFVGTLALAGKGDQEYSSSTKQNVTRLTSIYLFLGILALVGFALYFYLSN